MKQSQNIQINLFSGSCHFADDIAERIVNEIRLEDLFAGFGVVANRDSQDILNKVLRNLRFSIAGYGESTAEIYAEFKASIERLLQKQLSFIREIRAIVPFLPTLQGLTLPMDAIVSFWHVQMQALHYCIYSLRGEDADMSYLVNKRFDNFINQHLQLASNL